MKKILYVLSITAALFFAFSFNVRAATYHADELTRGQHFNAGDIIDFGSGTYDNKAYNYVQVSIDAVGRSADIIYPGGSFEIYKDCYFYWYGIYEFTNNNTHGYQLSICLENIYMYFSETEGGAPLPYCSEENQVIDMQGSSSKRVYLVYEGGTAPIEFEWVADHEFHHLGTNWTYFDVGNPRYSYIACRATCPSGAPTLGYNAGYVGLCVEGLPSNTEDEEESNSSSEENSVIDNVPQTPSTVSGETAQVSVGSDNKNFANIKVLNQYLHDSVNQKILADLYAAKLRKKANVLLQKNVIPPWGVDNKWKTTSHTVRWKDLNVKKGDTVMIVWYIPTFFGQGSTLKYISATVVDDGIIEFTIPAMGDMSVMSIVKLI